MMNEIELPVFLGICQSALIRGEGVSQDFYGVSDLLLLPFFPQSLKGTFLLLGIHKTLMAKPIRILIRSKENPDQKGQSDLHIELTTGDRQQVRINGFSDYDSVKGTWLLLYPGMQYKLAPIPCPPIFVTKPCEIEVVAELENRESQIGAFRCEFCPTPPISPEERSAIMSRTGAVGVMWFGLQCKKCQERVEYYLPLDQKSRASHNAKGGIFLLTAPDEWNCKCGAAKIPLIYLKKGLHEIFRRAIVERGKKELRFVPLYQRGAIAAIKAKYQKMLVDNADDEESVQKFIESNPILWNFLAPVRIWKKPSIVTKYKADFGILTTSKILYFVEIEKPGTRLVIKSGGVSARLQAGLDQIRDWQIEVEQHRATVLDGLGLIQRDIHDIRYILIAGMASETSSSGITKIKRMKDPCSVFCFDELASFLHCTEMALLNI